MKLTTNKLESLILEMMEDGYSREQKRKILALIRKTRGLLREIYSKQRSYPRMISDLYKDGNTIESRLERLTKDPFWKPHILKHYGNLQSVANIIEEVNQYLVLLEDLELDGNLAFTAKKSIYGGLSELAISEKFLQAVKFLEDIQNFDESFFAQDNVNLEVLFDVSDSFYNNYSNLKDYLDRVVWT